MALFHLSVTQTKRSAGQSAIASAAYPQGRRDMLRHSPAVPCTERIRRPSDPMERRGKSRAWKDGTACIQL